MFNLKIAISTLLIFSCLNAFAQTNEPINTIVTSVPFLRISSNMNLGMGNLNVVASPYNTQGSAIHNPARMFQSEANISINHTPWLRSLDLKGVWISDINGHFVINERHAIGLYGRRFNLGNIDVRDAGGNLLRTLNPMEYSTGLAYSYRASEHLSFGINASYIYSRLGVGIINGLEIFPAQTFSVGFGGLYQNDFETNLGKVYWSIGTMISDIGPGVSYTGSSFKEAIPTNASLGGMIGIREIAPKLDIFVAYQMDKLLVPTPDTIDNNGNGIMDYKELTLVQGMFGSFSDASGGVKEEWREISHSFGLEAMYNFNTKMRAGLRLGGFYEHETKGNRKYLTSSASFSYAGFYANIGYLFPRGNRTNPLDHTISMNIGYQLGI